MSLAAPSDEEISMRLPRRVLPIAAALLSAALALPVIAGPVAADGTDYAAQCPANLRSAPSISASTVDTLPTGAVVSVVGTVPGDPWTASCPSSVSGSTWFAISAVNGTPTANTYGSSPVYAASGLFGPLLYAEGIDVSKWQNSIDWTQVARAGKTFAVMKATEGSSYLDPMYAANHAGARAVGIKTAAYHFAQPSSTPGDAVAEADWFVANAAPQPGDLVPALDIETANGLGVAALQAWVQAWLDEVTARLGVRPMIYTSPNFWKNYLGNTTMFADQGYSILWVANWGVSSPTLPANGWGGHGWTFWQYSNQGSVAGIGGRVDLDRYNGLDLTPVTFEFAGVPNSIPAPNPAPVLVSVAPTAIVAASPATTITVQGANFVAGVTTAAWNGTALTTTVQSSLTLTAIVPAGQTMGTALVTVVNAAPGGGVSSAVPVTVTAPPAQITLVPSTTVTTWPQKMTLAARIAGSVGAGRALTIQRLQAGETTWTDVSSGTTDASGLFTLTYAPPVNTQFRATFAGAPDLGAAASTPFRVVVRELVLLRPSNWGSVRSLPLRSAITYTATVRPAAPSVKVTFAFYRYVSGRWTRVTTRDAYTGSTGLATYRWTFPARGQWYVRAIANPTPMNANSQWSPVERYSIY